MKALADRIRRDGTVLPGGLLKVDRFLNHRLEPELTLAMGRAFRERFSAIGVDRIDAVLTAEVSGIAPALAVGVAYGAPVVYARKRRPATMAGPVLQTEAPSRTKGGSTPLLVAADVLPPGDRVLVIDDFLASGRTIAALGDLVLAANATLVGIGVVIEKTFESGRDELSRLNVPVVALAAVDALDEDADRAYAREG